MDRVALGGSELLVSKIGFGCWAILGGFNWGPQEESYSIAAMQAAFETGVNFFDTAEGYGDGASERMLAKALGPHRDQLIIASKVSPGHLAPADLRAACERSLAALQTDVIDLYQIHFYNRQIPLMDTLGALRDLQQEGKIRAIGVSNFGPKQLAEAIATGTRIVSNQLAYSLLFRAVEYDLLPACRAHGVDVLCYSPLMQGLLAGRYFSPDQLAADRRRTRHFDSAKSEFARHAEGGPKRKLSESLTKFE